MSDEILVGDTVYAGYPTAHVHRIGRNRSKKLALKKAKHLLWGDWIQASDYDFREDDERLELKPAFSDADEERLQELVGDMVPVRVRGVSGYMHRGDLEQERLLEIVFVDVGQGDGALLVTPDDRKYVIDAGEGENMYRYLRWRFRNFEKAHTDFDGLIITHPDKDHYEGFRRLFEDGAVRATNIWHNGVVEQFGKKADGSQSLDTSMLLGERAEDDGQHYLVGLVEDDASLTTLLADPDRWIKQTTGRSKMFPGLLHDGISSVDDQGDRRFADISMLSTAHGEIHGDRSFLPGHGAGNQTECEIEIVGPVVEPDAVGKARLRTFVDKPTAKTVKMHSGKTKNGHSVLLRLKYRNFSVLFGGDLNSSAEIFLLSRASGRDFVDPDELEDDELAEIRDAAADLYGADVTKACHHGSADFTDLFLSAIKPSATVISSGDEESHAHPRCDTLGAVGLFGRGRRPLIFSTELARSTREFTKRDDTPWYQAARLEGEAVETSDPEKKAALLLEAKKLWEQEEKTNVTVYGSINLRSDGEKAVLAYMLEKPSKSRRWDVYPLEASDEGDLEFLPKEEAKKREKARRRATS